MNIKIYLIIFIFIIPSFNNAVGYEYNFEEIHQYCSEDIEVNNFNLIPIWEVGDSWKYKIYEIVFVNEELNNPINITFDECVLTLEVVETLGNYYTLDFNTKLYGTFELIFDNYNIKIFGKFNIFNPLRAHGSILIDKNNLSINDFTLYLSGLFKINFANKLLFTFPVPIDLCIELSAEPDLKILNFPLIVENIYGLPSFNITIDGEFSSPWFRIIKTVNRISKLFGSPLFSDEFADFLPRIDFGDILEWYSGDNVYFINNLTWYDVPVFAVAGFENITTLAGTYEAYHILFPFDMGSIYYAPEVGNIIILELNPFTRMELIETTFSD